ncbi:MAG: DUF4864 domain-containing protein [Alphaproteobacteria bacterium]|jgi:hypothetical protein|nr:DUF4864 domain-containing protein [Alphaproteobacteria bacterium]
MRLFLALAMMMTALLHPVLAQEDGTPWQAAVSGQIAALQAGDAAAALDFAGEGFRTQFAAQPEAFLAAVEASGYGPIVRSRSHSFGSFERVSETVVAQVVKLVGPDQALYEALYQLVDEPDIGWHVLGVALRKQPGIGI